VFIFIMPPSLEILQERLRNRKSDHENEIKNRMQRARDEMRDYTLYDYVIVNRDFDRALLEIRSVITAERCRTRLIDPAWMQGLLT
jgi:guanylate kinase